MSAEGFRFRWEKLVRSAQMGKRGNGGMSVLAVALVLGTWASKDGSNVYPGVERLATECGCDVSTIIRALAKLRDTGWIERVREGNSRTGKADVYRLSIPTALHGSTATQSPGSHGSTATQSATDCMATRADHMATTGDWVARRDLLGGSTAIPPVQRPDQEPLHHQYRRTSPVDEPPPAAAGSGEGQSASSPEAEPPTAAHRHGPWAGLDDSPVPPPAAAFSGIEEAASSPEAEPPTAAHRDSPWAGLNNDAVPLPPSFFDDDDSEPPAAATRDGDGSGTSAADSFSAAESLGYWEEKRQRRQQRLDDREAGGLRDRYVPAYCR